MKAWSTWPVTVPSPRPAPPASTADQSPAFAAVIDFVRSEKPGRMSRRKLSLSKSRSANVSPLVSASIWLCISWICWSSFRVWSSSFTFCAICSLSCSLASEIISCSRAMLVTSIVGTPWPQAGKAAAIRAAASRPFHLISSSSLADRFRPRRRFAAAGHSAQPAPSVAWPADGSELLPSARPRRGHRCSGPSPP